MWYKKETFLVNLQLGDTRKLANFNIDFLLDIFGSSASPISKVDNLYSCHPEHNSCSSVCKLSTAMPSCFNSCCYFTATLIVRFNSSFTAVNFCLQDFSAGILALKIFNSDSSRLTLDKLFILLQI